MNFTRDILRIEELSLSAWPSLQQILYDGWVLRFAGGYTRRSNSVNPLYPGNVNLDRKIRHCEDVYRDMGLPAIFKLTSGTQPLELRSALVDAGYREEAATSVQTLDLGRWSPSLASDPRPGRGFKCWDRPSEDWLSACVRFTPGAETTELLLRAIVSAIVPPVCFAAVTDADGICACGLGVIQDGWLGLFDIVTRPDRRREGFGRQVVERLLDWGRASGAAGAYLQVMLENPPARALYAGIGFREMYQYAYLVEPLRSPRGS